MLFFFCIENPCYFFSRSRRSPPSMSLGDYMSMAEQYMNMASKRTGDETDFTDRDKMIALHAQFMEDSNMIEIKSPEYLKGIAYFSLLLVKLPYSR